MERLKEAAVLIDLIKALREKGSWCGETHIQKSVYLLQELWNVSALGFEFILYKHGPFSFDLRDELTALRAVGLIDLELQSRPYGPRYISTKTGEDILEKFRDGIVAEIHEKTLCLSSIIGSKGVADLERLATALYMIKQSSEATDDVLASKLVKLKPHIQLEPAQSSLQEIRDISARYELQLS